MTILFTKEEAEGFLADTIKKLVGFHVEASIVLNDGEIEIHAAPKKQVDDQ